VIIAVIAGIIVGLAVPDVAKSLGVLGELFVKLIKMMITPVIFCTVVIGIGKLKASAVGKVGGLAVGYFLVMSTFALAIGLVVGNLIKPGQGLDIAGDPGKGAELAGEATSEGGPMEFIANIIPETLFSSLTAGTVLQALFVALLVGFAIQGMG
jgi:aerobic C4-dicarboxylate transport protein